MFSLEPVSIGSVPVVTWTELTATVVLEPRQDLVRRGDSHLAGVGLHSEVSDRIAFRDRNVSLESQWNG